MRKCYVGLLQNPPTISLMPKEKLLIFVEHYLPGYKFGGPIRSVANLVSLLKEHYDIYVVTRDRDEGDTKAYEQVVIGEWLNKDNYHLIYLPPQDVSVRRIKQILTERSYDFIYTNSLFSVFTRILLLLSTWMGFKLTIAPRGELHTGAIQLKSYKKIPYVGLVRLFSNNRIIWHATDQQEVAAISQYFNRSKVRCVPIRFAPDLPGGLSKRIGWMKQPGLLRLLSVARIARNKGLKFLLEIMQKMNEGMVILDIYGPVVDPGYWAECQQLIKELPANCSVSYKGEIVHAQVESVMQEADFLAMPTHGENFGHVIFEALSCGLPVLISDLTPWRRLSDKQAGWDLPLERDRWLGVLQQCLRMDLQTYGLLVAHACQVAKDYVDDESFENTYLSLFPKKDTA
jgi:glycosyltransferase involved in cell wall biosynthesis